jgi:hypothetical protein
MLAAMRFHLVSTLLSQTTVTSAVAAVVLVGLDSALSQVWVAAVARAVAQVVQVGRVRAALVAVLGHLVLMERVCMAGVVVVE